jgi:plasmid maintenance system antidote protein VapI
MKPFMHTKLKNIHPGEVLLKGFLIPLNISPYRLLMDIGFHKPALPKS